jgi:3-hydroxymyristoyl/3-hydroxydecanoyl-(acyl carrier protein) dehydratase
MLLDTVLHEIAAATGIALDMCEISSVKFLSPASPGDELVIRHILSASGAKALSPAEAMASIRFPGAGFSAWQRTSASSHEFA